MSIQHFSRILPHCEAAEKVGEEWLGCGTFGAAAVLDDDEIVNVTQPFIDGDGATL